MNTFVLFVTVAMSLTQVSSSPAPSAGIPSVADTPAAAIRRGNETDICCVPESSFVPLYRAYNGPIVDHFYTTSVTELDNAVNQLGYSPEGITGRVLTAESDWPYVKAVPLYRAYNPQITDHFYTASESEWNNAVENLEYSREGIAGYIYAEQVCGSIPLYRTYDVAGTDHFYTTNEQEYEGVVAGGFANEGIVGYVLPA